MNNLSMLIYTTMDRCRDGKLLRLINMFGIIIFSEPNNTEEVFLYKPKHSGEMSKSDMAYLYDRLTLMFAPFTVKWSTN